MSRLIFDICWEEKSFFFIWRTEFSLAKCAIFCICLWIKDILGQGTVWKLRQCALRMIWLKIFREINRCRTNWQCKLVSRNFLKWERNFHFSTLCTTTVVVLGNEDDTGCPNILMALGICAKRRHLTCFGRHFDFAKTKIMKSKVHHYSNPFFYEIFSIIEIFHK